MLRLITKTRTVGAAWGAVFPRERHLQLLHLVRYGAPPGGDRERAVLVGQIALVELDDASVRQLADAQGARDAIERLPEGVDLDGFALAAWLDHQGYAKNAHGRGRAADAAAVWSLPHGLRLRFNEYARPNPDAPTQLLFAAVRKDLLWRDRETFVRWLSRQAPELDVLRSAPIHPGAAAEAPT